MENSTESFIDLRKLTKIYQTGSVRTTALNAVDLRIEANEYIGITGKSGSGKTTLLNMIAGIDNCTEGEILVDQLRVDQMNETQKAIWRGKKIGFIFQSFQLIPGLDLLNNVMLPMDFLGSWEPEKSAEKAARLLELVGLADHLHKKPSEISGGQQQRTAIARALANDPQILLADEPTGRLDSATSETIFSLFELLFQKGMTLIVVSHDRSIQERVSRLIRLQDGRIVAG